MNLPDWMPPLPEPVGEGAYRWYLERQMLTFAEAYRKAWVASLKPCIYVGEPSAWLKEGGAKETKDMVERLGMVPIALYRLDDQP